MTIRPHIAPLLADTAIHAWDDVVTRHTQRIIAAPKGTPYSVEDFSSRLIPIRQGLRDYVQSRSKEIPAYATLTVRLANFWQRSTNGALFKEYIWMYAASAKDKTLGRLQITFCPGGFVRSEYVAYPKRDRARKYQIEELSQYFREPQWFDAFKRGCLTLPRGFSLHCVAGNGVEVETDIREISESQWSSLNRYGLDTTRYFVIALDRHRNFLRHMTTDELSELLVGDWADLGILWPLLQGLAKSLAISHAKPFSPIVEATRRLTTSSLDSFSPESPGPRNPYTISNPVVANRIHGVIVNSLSKELENAGHKIVNDQARDLAILGQNGQVDILFEVKTDTSTFSIYSGVGQLLVHGATQDPEPRRVLVLPKAVNTRLSKALQKIKIHVLLYSLRDEETTPVFDSLSTALDRSLQE